MRIILMIVIVLGACCRSIDSVDVIEGFNGHEIWVGDTQMQIDEFEKFVKVRSDQGKTTYVSYRSKEKASLPVFNKLKHLSKSGIKIRIEERDPPKGLF